MRQRMERVVDDDYKFLNWNVRKLFGMVRGMKKRWCEDCGKFDKIVRVSPLNIFLK
jgi:hypothetical protein